MLIPGWKTARSKGSGNLPVSRASLGVVASKASRKARVSKASRKCASIVAKTRRHRVSKVGSRRIQETAKGFLRSKFTVGDTYVKEANIGN